MPTKPYIMRLNDYDARWVERSANDCYRFTQNHKSPQCWGDGRQLRRPPSPPLTIPTATPNEMIIIIIIYCWMQATTEVLTKLTLRTVAMLSRCHFHSRRCLALKTSYGSVIFLNWFLSLIAFSAQSRLSMRPFIDFVCSVCGVELMVVIWHFN